MDLKYRTSVSDDKCFSFWSIHATCMYLKVIAWVTKCIRQLQFSPSHLRPLVYRNVFPHSMKQYKLYFILRQHISICCHVHAVSVLIHKALVNGLWLHYTTPYSIFPFSWSSAQATKKCTHRKWNKHKLPLLHQGAKRERWKGWTRRSAWSLWASRTEQMHEIGLRLFCIDNSQYVCLFIVCLRDYMIFALICPH